MLLVSGGHVINKLRGCAGSMHHAMPYGMVLWVEVIVVHHSKYCIVMLCKTKNATALLSY